MRKTNYLAKRVNIKLYPYFVGKFAGICKYYNMLIVVPQEGNRKLVDRMIF